MLLGMRNKKTNELFMKDVLDVDYDMSVSKENNKYIVNINKVYKLDEEFLTQQQAEQRMISVANARNLLEQELRNV